MRFYECKIPSTGLVSVFFFKFCLCKFAPNKAKKPPLVIRGYKKKNIKDENYSGEQQVGIDIPLKNSID